MPGDVPDDEAKKKQPGFDALAFFASKLSPASSIEKADLLYSTVEISNAIAEHSGIRLETQEVYSMMTAMGYKCDTTENLEFVWLLKKD